MTIHVQPTCGSLFCELRQVMLLYLLLVHGGFKKCTAAEGPPPTLCLSIHSLKPYLLLHAVVCLNSPIQFKTHLDSKTRLHERPNMLKAVSACLHGGVDYERSTLDVLSHIQVSGLFHIHGLTLSPYMGGDVETGWYQFTLFG